MQILCQVVNLYIAIIFGRIILSWFPTSRGTILGTISDFLFGLTEPVLGPIRRLIPPVGPPDPREGPDPRVLTALVGTATT